MSLGRQRGHAQAADKISRAGDAAEPLINRLGARQIVDQHHGAGAVGAGIEAERRPLPVDAYVAGILGIERAVAITQTADKGAAGFFAEDIAVRLPPLIAGFLDQLRQAARDAAEKVVPGVDDLVGGELIAGRRRLRRRRRNRPGRRAAAVPDFAPSTGKLPGMPRASRARPIATQPARTVRQDSSSVPS